MGGQILLGCSETGGASGGASSLWPCEKEFNEDAKKNYATVCEKEF